MLTENLLHFCFRFVALDEKQTTGSFAHPVTVHVFVCQCQFFVSPCRLRLPVGPGQGVTSCGLRRTGIAHQIGDL
jgi:hypothetical protein